MFKNPSLPVKVSLAFFPLFLVAVSLIAYFNYSSQQEQMMAQMQSGATAQANTIRQSLVNMMVTNEMVDENYLKQISSSGDIRQIHILFRLDSLHLDDSYMEDSSRVYRLAKREIETWDVHRSYLSTAMSMTTPHWYLTCNLKLHNNKEINNLSTDKPVILHSCEQMEALIPFVAEKKCTRCHNVQIGSVLGAAVMTVPLDKAAIALQTNAFNSLYIFLGFIIISLVLNTVIFRKFVDNPLKKLIGAAAIIGTGKPFEKKLRDEFSRDEFGKLAEAFNEMQINLQKIQNELVHKERLSTVGQMASSIVHDFRTPLSNASIALDYLLRHADAPSEKRDEMYSLVKESMLRMTRMMQELLDFSKGEFQLHFSSCAVENLAEIIKKEYAAHFQNSSIEFLISCHSYGEISVDKERLLRAVGNLINNAEDAMPNGGILTFTILTEQNNTGIRFSVKDSGNGIPDDVRETLFEPFVTAGKKHGTGLGLAITKRVVDLHGGSISFTTEPGKGTEFIITIPRNV